MNEQALAQKMQINWNDDLSHLHNPDPLEFPRQVMTGAAGEIAYTFTKYLEAPAQFFYFSALTCFGAFFSGKLTLDSEIKPQPRLYTLLLAESADDRKSTAITKVVELFKMALTEFYVCDGVGSSEGLVRIFKNHKSVILCLDEFKHFISKSGIKASTLLECLSTLFEKNDYSSVISQKENEIRNGHLSLLAASTKETYERCWEREFTDIGLNNRIFLVSGSGSRKFSIPKTIPDQVKRNLVKEIFDVIKLVGEGLTLIIDKDALGLYDDWYHNKRAKSVHAKRLETYAMRLMILIAVSDGLRNIDLATVQKTIMLVDWQLKLRMLFDPIDADNKVAKLEIKIRRLLELGQKNKRYLRQYTNADKEGLWAFNQALENLIREKDILWRKNGKDIVYSIDSKK